MKITFSFEPDEEKQVQEYLKKNYYICADPCTIKNGFDKYKFEISLENCMVQAIGIG